MKRLAILAALCLLVSCRKESESIPMNGVALWLIADKAVNGTVSAPAPDAQPTVVANAINGQPVLKFDGKDDMLMSNVDFGPVKTPEATVIAVFRSNTAEKSPLRKLYGNDNGGFDRAVGLDDRADNAENYALFTGRGVSGLFQLEANKTYLTVDQFSPKQFSSWMNGAPTVSKIETDWSDSLPNLYIGNTGTVFSEFWDGDLAEFIVYSRALSDGERKQVEQYLAKKYGIAIQ